MAKRKSPNPKSAIRNPHSPADLLFEIGTEELPAAYLPDLIAQLKSEGQRLFNAHHLSFTDVQSFGTPRRLVLIVRELGGTQHNPAEDIRGPSNQAAYDGAGKPTPALLGFLRSRNGTISQTKLVESEKGAYIYLVKPPTEVPTTKVLPMLLPQLVSALRAPKTMRWDASGVRFARPIRWLLALYGTQPVRCTLGRLMSTPKTWVGGPKRPRPVAASSLEQYQRALKAARIILNQQERRRRIEQMVAQVAAKSHGIVAPEMVSHGLLDEVTFLVEEPVPLVGTFDHAYLALPREVLLASMAKYQRVFAIESSGKILPQFVAILDGPPKQPAGVRKVCERILNARLADSAIFVKEDRTHLPLERMAAALSGITFHEKLGSMAEKTLRLRGLGETVAEAWRLTDEERQQLRRACMLAKADLVSTMVKEFPTLQGVMGKYYAKESGESPAVAEAIEEHYLPAAAQAGLPTGDHLPKTLIGSALAIVDKYDTLTSYFGLGIEPTGDQDPFGLRRAAQGIVEVAWAAHRPLPLEALLRTRASMAPFQTAQPKDIAVVGQRIQRYLFERLYTFAWPEPATARPGAGERRAGEPGAPAASFGPVTCEACPGLSPRNRSAISGGEAKRAGVGDRSAAPGVRARPPSNDCIDAVLSSPCEDLVDVMDRIRSLQRLHGHASLLKAAKVIERTHNILKGAALRQPQVDPSRLREPLEQQLWNVYGSHQEEIARLAQDRSYADATTRFGDVFFEPIHEFFEHVLVNVPEEALQQNRLALMKAINTLYTQRVADLSKLTILHTKETR